MRPQLSSYTNAFKPAPGLTRPRATGRDLELDLLEPSFQPPVHYTSRPLLYPLQTLGDQLGAGGPYSFLKPFPHSS